VKKVLIAGFQHETNTFAPSKADWQAFNRGDSFPAFTRGRSMQDKLTGVNIPVGGFIDFAKLQGWKLLPSVWAGAIPSAHVTKDAFERIASAILDDVQSSLVHGLDAVYLDLHGAAVAEHIDDTEGVLIERIRALIGPDRPIVASLDLHANVTEKMLNLADALVSYRTYPHVDMAATGELAGQLLTRRWALGMREALCVKRFPYLIALNAQSTLMQPAQEIYAKLQEYDQKFNVIQSFCMGFPAADFAECGPVMWAYAADHPTAETAVNRLFQLASPAQQWNSEILTPSEAVQQAVSLAKNVAKPVIIADTQDNPGAGGDSNTTGMLHALLQQHAGKQLAGQVALGMLYDPTSAAKACAAGVGAELELALGSSVPTYAGFSDPPLQGRFKVVAISEGNCTLTGPMMKGLTLQLGPSACLEIEGILIAVTSGKKQLLDRQLLRMVGIHSEQMKLIVVKSSVHFRADFQPNSSHILVAKAKGPMAADPADLPWKKLNPKVRARA
jgi:microcystin degradation protein MlrC